MSIMNKLETCEKILDFFKHNHDAKVRALSLANELNLDPVVVEEILKKCRSFFTYMTTEKQFKLNKMSRFKGDVVMMKINAEDMLREDNFFQKHWYLITLSILLIAIFVMLGYIGN